MGLTKLAFWRTAWRAVRGARLHVKLSDPKVARARLIHRVGFGIVYDLFLKSHLQKPDAQTYNLLQSFKNYVMMIDPLIDSPDYLPRRMRTFAAQDLRKIAESKEIASEFVRRVKQSNFSAEQKREILKIMGGFRRKATAGISLSMQDPFAQKEKVFKGIKQTSGLFLGTVSEIASVCHGVKGPDAKITRIAFENFTNALQIMDDMRDAAMDFGICQNAIVSISKRYPEEMARLRETVKRKRKKLSKRWLKKNMPKTARAANVFFEKYANKIPKARKEIAKACRDAFYRL